MTPQRNAVAYLSLVRNQTALRVCRRARGVEHQADVAHTHAQSQTMDFHLVYGARRGLELCGGEKTRRRGTSHHHEIAKLRRRCNGKITPVSALLEARQCLRQTLDEVDLI